MLIEMVKNKELEWKCGCVPHYNDFGDMPCFTKDNKLFYNVHLKSSELAAQFPYTLEEWNTIAGITKYAHPKCDKIPYRIIKNSLKE